MSSSSLSYLLAEIDEQRALRGFLSVRGVLELKATGNVVLDPFSTLVSMGAKVGSSNIFYPNVTLELGPGGVLEIGSGNCMYPQTFIRADYGCITVGNGNTFGEGGVSLRVSSPKEKLTVGDAGRYDQQATITGTNALGSGSQVLGHITVRGCTLAGGGSFEEPDPNLRGGVLKGYGVARGLFVGRGEVISTRVLFEQAALERQEAYHPKPGGAV